jgi:hypothetical protein
MMTGDGPFGSVEMGGMFSMLKVRRDQKPGDYGDPGWFKQPTGTQAFEWTGGLAEPARFAADAPAGSKPAMPAKNMPMHEVEVQVRKPKSHSGH